MPDSASIITTGLVVALIVLVSISLRLQKAAAARVESINARLAQQLVELERAQEGLRLADVVVKHTGEGILVLDADFRVKSVNPGFERMTGYSAAEILGRTPQMLVAEEHAMDCEQLIRSHLLASDQWEGPLLARHKQGEDLPMEVNVDVVRGDSDAVMYHVMVLHDMSAQKQLEERLRELSATDGLTMVANRRTFDEVLDREWHRAMRDQEALSLLMADIDLFKSFNDVYGHVAGDDCLRQVAAAIADCAKRGGDLVARYGGEEFAVILPRMDAAAAQEVAETIRQRVETLAIPHQGNPATGRVTISLGVSTRMPPIGSEMVSLVESADKALYEAKGSGRNAVAASP